MVGRIRVAVALVVLGSLTAHAAAGTPTDRLRQFFAAASTVIADEATATRPHEKMETIRRLVRDLFAFAVAAEHALGEEWSARTPAERAEFVALFSDVAESWFVSALAARARLAGGPQITVLGESQTGDSATVQTVVAARSGSDIHVDYHMRRLAGRWVVHDVEVDGVSLVSNYRAQTRRMIARGSFAGLLAEMRARVSGGPGATGTEIASPPEPATRPSQTAAVAGSTAVDVDASPTSARVLAAHVVSPTSPGASETFVSPEVLGATAARRAAPAPAAGSLFDAAPAPSEVPRASTAAAPVAAVHAPATPIAGGTTTATQPAAPAASPDPMGKPVATAGPPSTVAAARSGAAVRASTAAARRPALAAVTPGPAGSPAKVAASPASTSPRTARAKARGEAAQPSPSSFWVQVGAFRTLEAAGHMAARLRDQPLVIGMTEARNPLLRVLVGPFGDHAGAAAALRMLRAKGLRPFITTTH